MRLRGVRHLTWAAVMLGSHMGVRMRMHRLCWEQGSGLEGFLGWYFLWGMGGVVVDRDEGAGKMGGRGRIGAGKVERDGD